LLLLCWHCSDIKLENVLVGLSPFASPKEVETFMEAVKEGGPGVGTMHIASSTLALSDAGGASVGGLARPAERGYGTRWYQAPELRMPGEDPALNMSLVVVWSLLITYFELRYAGAGSFNTGSLAGGVFFLWVTRGADSH
jgi:hypothetical protein